MRLFGVCKTTAMKYVNTQGPGKAVTVSYVGDLE